MAQIFLLRSHRGATLRIFRRHAGPCDGRRLYACAQLSHNHEQCRVFDDGTDPERRRLRDYDPAVQYVDRFQKFHPFADGHAWGERPSIRRLVAFPGDSIYMEDFVLHVKAKGSTHYLTEYEVAGNTYNLTIDKLPENWTKDLPLSDHMAERVLGANEYFVLCDNRITASDSRSWGSIPASRIKGKVLFRYWPFSHAGKP
jgi:signal peptidase I